MRLRFLFAFLFIPFLTTKAFADTACAPFFPSITEENGELLNLPTFNESDESDGDSLNGFHKSLPAGEYGDVKVWDPNGNDNKILTFTTDDGLYLFNTLELGENSTVRMPPGDYYIDSLIMDKDTTIELTGSGTVRIYANSVVADRNIRINDDGSKSLVFISYGDITIGKDSRFKGAMHAKNDISVGSNTGLYGAVTAGNNISDSNGTRSYDEDYYIEPDFNGMCTSEPVPVSLELHYLFNEGTGDDVYDSSGNDRHAIFGKNNGIPLNPEWECETTGAYLTFTADGSKSDRISRDSFTPPMETTISFWMKVPALPTSTQRIFGMAHGWEARWAKDDNNELHVYFDINNDDNSPDNDDAIRTDKTFTNADVGKWIHFAFRGSEISGEWDVYVGGDPNNSGTVNFEAQSIESELWLGGSSWKTNGESLTGSLDDFRLYRGLLTDTEIDALADNPPTECVPGIVAYYSFEQESFVDDVIEDFSGNNNNATNIREGKSVAGGKYCRGYDTDGDSGANGSYYGINTHLDVNSDIGNEGTVSFWFKAAKAWGNKRSTLFDASFASSSKYFYLEIEDTSGHLRFKFENDDDDDYTVEETATVTRTVDTWYYLSVTWDLGNDIFEIYVDGSLVAQRSDYNTGGDLGELSELILFDNAPDSTTADSQSTDGIFDEVRIYNEARSQAQIQADMNDNACQDGLVNHYEILHNLTGFTCAPEEITVKACINDSSETCEESTDQAIGLTLNAIGSYSVDKPLSFTDSINTSISYTTGETVTLSLSEAVPDALEPYVCIDNNTGAESSCEIAFLDSGFRFIAGGSETLLTQLSNKPSNTGYNANTWQLQAIQKNTETGACEGALQGDVLVNLRAVCTSPSSCAGANVTINGDNISTENNTQNPITFTPVTLDFGDDSTSTADFIFKYPDAGQLKLAAQYQIPLDPNSTTTNPSLQYMSGESNTFVVKPFGFYIDNVFETANTSNTNPKAENATGDKFISAESEFSFDVSAKQWATGQDGNNNGIHDDDDDISGNANTPNFDDTLELTHSLVAPSVSDGGNLGTLTITDTGSFTAGVASFSARYSEVGVIELLASDDGNYINGVSGIQGDEPYIGRFIPDYFTQTVEVEGVLEANHNDTCAMMDWAYAGQENPDEDSGTGVINYAIEPIIKITAYNASGVITQNYTVDNFMKLTAQNVHEGLISPNKDAAQLRTDNVGAEDFVRITSQMNEGSLTVSEKAAPDSGFNNGVMEYTYNTNDYYVYEHNAHSLLSPFAAEIPFNVRNDSNDGDLIKDSDDVTVNSTVDFTTTGVEIYFGRWFIENAYGPETSDLVVPMFVQYYDESIDNFLTHKQDDCTAASPWVYTLTDQGDAIDPDDTAAITPILVSDFASGEYRDFIFSAPSSAARGSLLLEYEVPNWFKYNWLGDDDDDGEFVDDPQALITFGLYRGNDRIISWREIEN